MTFEQWLKQSCFQCPPKEAEDLARRAWRHAEHNASMAEVDIAIRLTEATYQSKRAKLKKQVTHWMGKFSIVKQENNRLREINKALVNRTKHLREYITQKEIRAITQVGDNTLRELKMPAPLRVGKPLKC